MSIEIVADKYSSAMFELAQEQNKLELMEEQLGYVASVMVDQPELRSFLENPIVTEDAKIKLIGKIFDSSIDKVALREVTGKDVILSVSQDPSIMGGIVIQVGDKRIDGSVARRLEELEKSLLRTNSIR